MKIRISYVEQFEAAMATAIVKMLRGVLPVKVKECPEDPSGYSHIYLATLKAVKPPENNPPGI